MRNLGQMRRDRLPSFTWPLVGPQIVHDKVSKSQLGKINVMTRGPSMTRVVRSNPPTPNHVIELVWEAQSGPGMPAKRASALKRSQSGVALRYEPTGTYPARELASRQAGNWLEKQGTQA